MTRKVRDCTGTGSSQALMGAMAIASQITWAAPPLKVLNIDTCLYPARRGSGFLLAIFTKVCVFFFPSLHSRVYPEWFNYNFPCVRQIKEESRSVGPSTWFISLTDCSSPNPRAAAAAAAHGSPKDARGRGRSSTWHGNARPSRDWETSRNLKNTPKLARYYRGPMKFHTEHSQVLSERILKAGNLSYSSRSTGGGMWWGILRRNQGRASKEIHFTNALGE